MLATAPTIATTRHALAEQLRQAGIDSADADARLLISHALSIDRAELMANGARALNPDEAKAIAALGERRLKREPVARIFGRKEFWSLSLHISPAVLVPRKVSPALLAMLALPAELASLNCRLLLLVMLALPAVAFPI